MVMTADLKAWKKDPQRYWRDAPRGVAVMLVRWMGPFYEGKDQLQRDEAMRSIGHCRPIDHACRQGHGL